MRLIDADRLKEVIDKTFYGIHCSDGIAAMHLTIDEQPTAFDKGKVIANLRSQYNYSREVRNKDNNVFFEYWEGRVDSYKDAIDIVEKGGIDG